MSGSSFCAGWSAFWLLVAVPAACAEPIPAPSLEHLAALSDIRGVSEFARGRAPLRERFCLEDTARALVAVLRVHAAGAEPRAAELARGYLRAIVGLRDAEGRFRFGFQGWDGPMERLATGDQLGRLLWGLGHASAQGVDDPMKLQAAALFREALVAFHPERASPMELSYALQGLHAYVSTHPSDAEARATLRLAADRLLARLPVAADWVWPGDRVTYDSGRLPLALLLATEALGDVRYREGALRVLHFLERANFPVAGGPLHVIGNSGWWERGREPAADDQQPIDASGLVEAYAAAWRATRDPRWLGRVESAAAWFLGRNDGSQALYEVPTGACHDALGHRGVNGNCGAEATVSALIALAVARELPAAPAVAHPPVWAFYYAWYGVPQGPRQRWEFWADRGEPAVGAKLRVPCRPLVGPYDSADPAVVAWHCRLAEAAGIDAFLVSWWGGANVSGEAFERVILPAARATRVKVALNCELAQFHAETGPLIERLAGVLARCQGDPAYLRRAGRPVVYLYQVPFDPKLTPATFAELRRGVEAKVGPVWWAMDKIRHDAGTYGVPAAWRATEGVDAFGFYGTFSVRRISERAELGPFFARYARDVRAAGRELLLPMHPALDNRVIQPKEGFAIPFREGETLEGYHAAALAAGADVLLLTSFNEWPEGTVVEPSADWPDPYRHLRQIARWKGREFVPPPLPAR